MIISNKPQTNGGYARIPNKNSNKLVLPHYIYRITVCYLCCGPSKVVEIRTLVHVSGLPRSLRDVRGKNLLLYK